MIKKKTIVNIVLWIGIIFAFIGVNRATNDKYCIEYSVDKQKIGIAFSDKKIIFIDGTDIVSVEKVNDVLLERAISQENWNCGWVGTYYNEKWGIFDAFIYDNVKEYIIINYKEGVLVFNGINRNETDKIYNQIKKFLL